MVGNIVTLLVGIVCIVLGISNMRGNISSLHSYHRYRVSEEDRIPFGKQVGLGTIIVGIGIIVFSILSSITLYTENNIFILVGTAFLIVGIILGLVISFRAMIKYNKGIF
jgi:predicted permease